MSKFEITVFMLVNVRSDDPEGSKGQCVTVTVENICLGLPVSTAEEGKNTTLRNVSTVMAISALKDFSRLPWVTASLL